MAANDFLFTAYIHCSNKYSEKNTPDTNFQVLVVGGFVSNLKEVMENRNNAMGQIPFLKWLFQKHMPEFITAQF